MTGTFLRGSLRDPPYVVFTTRIGLSSLVITLQTAITATSDKQRLSRPSFVPSSSSTHSALQRTGPETEWAENQSWKPAAI